MIVASLPVVGVRGIDTRTGQDHGRTGGSRGLQRPSAAHAAPAPSWGKVEVIDDKWGVPHVFADSDAGAMYGLGYAAGRDRAFQMHYALRLIQGRSAEVLGDRPSAARPTPSTGSSRRRT